MESSNAGTQGVQEHGDTTGIKETLESVAAEAVPQLAIGRSGARLVSLLGFLLVGAGAAFSAAPYFSWKLAEIATFAQGLGLQTGAVALTGLVLVAIGTVGGSIARLAERPRVSDTGMIDAVERMAEQVSLLTGSLMHLHEQVTAIGLREPVVHVDAPAPDDDLMRLYREQKDAVFGLAAGMDKLGQRLAESVGTEVGGLTPRFERLQAAVQGVEAQFLHTMDRLREELANRPTAATESPAAAHVDPPPAVPAQRVEVAPPVEIELEQPHTEVEPEVSPLAFLDGLKSIEPPSQNPVDPSVATPPLDFDGLDDGSRRSIDEPPAALPRQNGHLPAANPQRTQP